VEQELRKHLGLPNSHSASENGTGKAHTEGAKPNGDAHKVEAAKPAAKAATAGPSRASK
jgi:hypothetical protein